MMRTSITSQVHTTYCTPDKNDGPAYAAYSPDGITLEMLHIQLSAFSRAC